jgi:hypothetical protein
MDCYRIPYHELNQAKSLYKIPQLPIEITDGSAYLTFEDYKLLNVLTPHLKCCRRLPHIKTWQDMVMNSKSTQHQLRRALTASRKGSQIRFWSDEMDPQALTYG